VQRSTTADRWADRFREAVRHHAAGRLDAADAAYRVILLSEPGHAASLHGRGVIAHQSGRSDVAVELIGRAVAAEPRVAAFRTNLGAALRALGRTGEAAAAYRQAIAIDPADRVSLNNLANLLQAEGRTEEAIGYYRRALACAPNEPAPMNNLANALAAAGPANMAMANEAIRLYRRALALRPAYAEAHYNLANLLAELGDLDGAMASYRAAIAVRPDHLAARNQLGAALRQAGRYGEATRAYEAVLEIDPANAEAHSNLGRVFVLQGRLAEAGARYETALALKPDYPQARSNQLLWLNYSDETPEVIFGAHRAWAERVEQALPRRAPHANVRHPERRLRVGYVSPDFRAHSVASYLAPVIARHDRAAVEVVCYADVARPDAVTARFQAMADHWRPISGMSPDAIAERIRLDQIDILVDMAGHLAPHLLPAFARKPAPVQVSWIGYVNTTGLKAVDYRLVDVVTDPHGPADFFASERLVRLPGGFACFEPPADAPAPGPVPSLAAGHLTFGSFSPPSKLSEGVLDAWSEILRRLPGARLVLKAGAFDDEGTRVHLLARFAQRGIGAERIDLVSWIASSAGHLALYDRIDVALDPFPHNGYTTTCEALWMGAPVVALQGERHVARISASFLTTVGAPGLIAEDPDAYVDLAVGLATDPGRLAELRQTLRPRMAASPLCKAATFTRQLEAVYRAMWRRWCFGGDDWPVAG
jgi:protein O-GlcNAc transferase